MTSGYDIVIEKKTKAEFEVKATKTGENPQKCPVCSDQREFTTKSFHFGLNN